MSDRPHIGRMKAGSLDAISDVAGVKVGHATLAEGDSQTGVTVITTHAGDPFMEKTRAASVVLNGFGKSVGLMQLEELGVIETPIALTNTFSVEAMGEAQIRAACRAHPEIGRSLPTVNPLVLECNDGYLSDIQGMRLDSGHYRQALSNAAEKFERGSVGAGRGMSMFGVKGGIGSASRTAGDFTVGALVLANFGRASQLVVAGRAVGGELNRRLNAKPGTQDALRGASPAEAGSIIMIVGTDAPLEYRQLRRVARRAGAGLARTGSIYGHGSGDVVVAFSTQNRVPHEAGSPLATVHELHETLLDPLFQASADAVEQAILDALFSATAVKGFRGHERAAFLDVLPDWQSPR
jgi:D-aminopeptidase